MQQHWVKFHKNRESHYKQLCSRLLNSDSEWDLFLDITFLPDIRQILFHLAYYTSE